MGIEKDTRHIPCDVCLFLTSVFSQNIRIDRRHLGNTKKDRRHNLPDPAGTNNNNNNNNNKVPETLEFLTTSVDFGVRKTTSVDFAAFGKRQTSEKTDVAGI